MLTPPCHDQEPDCLIFNCPVEAALEALSGKWKPLIIWHLDQDAKRFGQLRRAIPGASEKVLVEQLRQLERSSVVQRQIVATVPPQVTYSLTEHGRNLRAATLSICQWGKEHAQKLGAKIVIGGTPPPQVTLAPDHMPTGCEPQPHREAIAEPTSLSQSSRERQL